MKLKALFSTLTLSIFLISCGSDDDSNDPFAGVPSSDIVEVELRDATLSGSGSSSGRGAAVGQKWWKQKISKIEGSGVCEDLTEDVTQGYYYGFYPSGEYYAKASKESTPVRAGSWQWEDNDTKEAILISSVAFTLRGLNSDELIIASDQSQGDCGAITWEQFNNPYEE
ncbi:hypothetical protein [Reichenbachiella sp.]|uniref:hypothetical protein n=1 Tax=Reichenbachiella sp. TaxID=2184521 RepID=UPI003B5C2D16